MGFRNSTGGGITQLTGEVTAGPGEGSQAATIASVITAGSIGGATAVPEITYNDAGQITGIASIAPDDATKIPLSTVTASGDLIVGTGAGTVGRLGIGANGDVLTVASGALSYVTPALTHDSQVLTANVTLPANTYASIFTTATWAPGVWLLIVSALVDLTTAGNCMIWVSGGTATYTKSGGEQQQFLNQTGYSSISFAQLVTVTAAGTVTIAVQTDATAAGSLEYTNFTSTGSYATGYVAVKVA